MAYHESADVRTEWEAMPLRACARKGTVLPSSVQLEAELHPFGVRIRSTVVSNDEAGPAGTSDEGSVSFARTWMCFGAKVCDLTRDSEVRLNLLDVHGFSIATGVLRLFTKKKGRLVEGRKTVAMYLSQQADEATKETIKEKLENGNLDAFEDNEEYWSNLERALKNAEDGMPWLNGLTLRRCREATEQHREKLRASCEIFLDIQLLEFSRAVIFSIPRDTLSTIKKSDFLAAKAAPMAIEGRFLFIEDAEIGHISASEAKSRKLERGLSRGRSMLDVGAKPNHEQMLQIQEAMQLPPGQPLTDDQRDLLWRFRLVLKEDGAALAYFTRCVDWSDAAEARHAVALAAAWAPVDAPDALPLLSQDVSNEAVRMHAIDALAKASDNQLRSFLLQLVQVLRYEREDDSPLGKLLVMRAALDRSMANDLHWYLFVAMEDPKFNTRFSKIYAHLADTLQIEGSEGESTPDTWIHLCRQKELLLMLANITKDLQSVRGAKAKTEKLRELVGVGGAYSESLKFPNGLMLPLDPSVVITEVVPDQSAVFRSALCPLRLTFRKQAQKNMHALESEEDILHGEKLQCADSTVTVIYKKGDDLRQDQLIVQMISMMDLLLKKESLDLKLTTYHVLATGSDSGLVEFIPSIPVATVLQQFNSIESYLAIHNPDSSGLFGIRPEVHQTFVKSCAGYSVITYILGVGDRHLDNLMLCQDGRLFHIDFGYIMGRDPKPFPPPMKICKEMVEAMGGAGSSHYNQFQAYCCEAYNILRKSSRLIINLFHLMAGSRIQDIPDISETIVLKLQSKLRPDLDDEAAVRHMRQLINDSSTALFQQVFERAHRWAQYWR